MALPALPKQGQPMVGAGGVATTPWYDFLTRRDAALSGDTTALAAQVAALSDQVANLDVGEVVGLFSVQVSGSLSDEQVLVQLEGDAATPGSNYYYGTDASGVKGFWPALPNPMTTLGDVITGGVDGDPQRLGIGAEGEVLGVVSGEPEYVVRVASVVAGTNVTVDDTDPLNPIVSAASGPTSSGRHAAFVPAGAMSPSATGGCADLATIASAANQPDIQTLDFDTTTQEYAQFFFRMPKSWDEGTITFAPVWSHAATTTNFGVVWDLQAVAISDDDAIAVAFGTAQTSTDTGGTTNDVYIGPESSAITVAGTPAAEDMVFFRISRVTGNGSDTMAIDARLHGVTVYLTTNAENDA